MGAGSPVIGASPGFRARWERFFGCDLRSLAALRIGLASVILIDLALRLPEIDLFYTDRGLLPRSINPTPLGVFPLSVHGYGDGTAFELLLFGVAFGFAAMMLIGYRTRLSTAVSWWLLASLQFRNPEIGNGGDAWLRITMFWCMFAPLGARWSIDAGRHLHSQHRQAGDTALSMATVALLLQPGLVYFFTAIQKWQSGTDWVPDGSAITLALQHEYWARPLGHWLLGFPDLLRVMTSCVVGLELIGPFLLFCPVFTAPIRALTLVAFVGLQMGLGPTLQLGFFPWVSTLALLPFLPAAFWERLARRARLTPVTRGEQPTATLPYRLRRKAFELFICRPLPIGSAPMNPLRAFQRLGLPCSRLIPWIGTARADRQCCRLTWHLRPAMVRQRETGPRLGPTTFERRRGPGNDRVPRFVL